MWFARGRRGQGKAAELINAMNKTPVKVARIKGQQGEYGTGQYEKGQNEFLQPLIDSGKVKVVCEQYTQNWDPTLAQSFAEDCLTRNGGDVDLFIAMNDGTAGGAVAALISQGFKPGQKLVAGGQNAEVEALRYIAQGWQDDSVLKDLRIQARDAAEVVAYGRARRHRERTASCRGDDAVLASLACFQCLKRTKLSQKSLRRGRRLGPGICQRPSRPPRRPAGSS